MSDKYYDKKIVPKLMEIARLCKAKNVPFLAVVEYNKGEMASTQLETDTECLEMVMTRKCLHTAPNIDAFIMGIWRYADEKNIDISTSMIFRKLKGDI